MLSALARLVRPRAGDQLRLSLFKGGDLDFQPLQFAVDARHLRLDLLILKVVLPMLLLDQRFHLSAEKPQPGVPEDRVLPVVELAGPDRLGDLVLRQPELLPRRLVAETCSPPLPLGIQLVHKSVLLATTPPLNSPPRTP